MDAITVGLMVILSPALGVLGSRLMLSFVLSFMTRPAVGRSNP